jgi:hypothetical protein
MVVAPPERPSPPLLVRDFYEEGAREMRAWPGFFSPSVFRHYADSGTFLNDSDALVIGCIPSMADPPPTQQSMHAVEQLWVVGLVDMV